MNAQGLADVVVHWLEYERLCGRERLLRELSLVRPIHEFLAAVETASIELEFPIPGLPLHLTQRKGQKKSIDVCLRRPTGGKAIQDVVETKLVRGDRDFTQEFFDDLFRLEWVRDQSQTEQFSRWFLVAGAHAELESHLINNMMNPGGGKPRIKAFNDILAFAKAAPSKNVSVHAAVPGVRKKWCKAAKAVGQSDIPLTFSTVLHGHAPASANPTDYTCFVWRVMSSNNRATRPA